MDTTRSSSSLSFSRETVSSVILKSNSPVTSLSMGDPESNTASISESAYAENAAISIIRANPKQISFFIVTLPSKKKTNENLSGFHRLYSSSFCRLVSLFSHLLYPSWASRLSFLSRQASISARIASISSMIISIERGFA